MIPINAEEAAAVELYRRLKPAFTASSDRRAKMEGGDKGNGDFTPYEVMLHAVLEEKKIGKKEIDEWCEEDIINFELLEDPVICPSGHSLSRETYALLERDPMNPNLIIDHRKPPVENKSLAAFMRDPTVGFFDPITRKPLEAQVVDEKNKPVCCVSVSNPNQAQYLGLTFNKETIASHPELFAGCDFLPNHKVNAVLVNMNARVTEKLNRHRSFLDGVRAGWRGRLEQEQEEQKREEKDAMADDSVALQVIYDKAKNLFSTQRNMEAYALLQTEIDKFNLANPILMHAKLHELAGDILDVEFINYNIEMLSDALIKGAEPLADNTIYVRLSGGHIEYLSAEMAGPATLTLEDAGLALKDVGGDAPNDQLLVQKLGKGKGKLLTITEKKQHTHTRDPKRYAADHHYRQAKEIYDALNRSHPDDIDHKISFAAFAVKAGKNYRDRRKKDGMVLLAEGEILVEEGLRRLDSIDIDRVSPEQGEEITYIRASLYDELWYLLNKQVEGGFGFRDRTERTLLAARKAHQDAYIAFCNGLVPKDDPTVLFIKARMHTAFTEENLFNEKASAETLKKTEADKALALMTECINKMPPDFQNQYPERYIKMLIQWGVGLNDAITAHKPAGGINYKTYRQDAQQAVRVLFGALRNFSGFNAVSLRKRIQTLQKHLGDHAAVFKDALETIHRNHNVAAHDAVCRNGLKAMLHVLAECPNDAVKKARIAQGRLLFDRVKLTSTESREDIEELLAVLDVLYALDMSAEAEEKADVPLGAEESKQGEVDAELRTLFNHLDNLCAEREPSVYAAGGAALYQGAEVHARKAAIKHLLTLTEDAVLKILEGGANPRVFFRLAERIVLFRHYKILALSPEIYGAGIIQELNTHCDALIASFKFVLEYSNADMSKFSKQGFYKLLAACTPLKGKALPDPDRGWAEHFLLNPYDKMEHPYSTYYKEFADHGERLQLGLLKTLFANINTGFVQAEGTSEFQKDILQMYFTQADDETFPKLSKFIDKLKAFPEDPNATALIAKIENFISAEFGPSAMTAMYARQGAKEVCLPAAAAMLGR